MKPFSNYKTENPTTLALRVGYLRFDFQIFSPRPGNYLSASARIPLWQQWEQLHDEIPDDMRIDFTLTEKTRNMILKSALTQDAHRASLCFADIRRLVTSSGGVKCCSTK